MLEYLYIPSLLAAPESPEAGGDYTGAVGQLIAAVLQTAGLFGQSQVIDFFTPLLQSIGTLVYVVGLMGALISFALYGNYRQGLYLFIGPWLFMWMLTNRVDAGPVLVQMGDRQSELNTQEVQVEFFERFSTADYWGQGPRLSWFFVEWDNLVSSVVQGLVAFLVDTENKQDLMNAAKERILAGIFLDKDTNPDYNELTGLATLGRCAKPNRLRMELAQPKYLNAQDGTPEAVEREIKEEQYNTLMEQKVVIPPGSVQNYIKNLDPETYPQGPTIVDGFAKPMLLTCREIWKYTVDAARVQGEATFVKLAAEQPELEPQVVEDEITAMVSDGERAKLIELIAAERVKKVWQNKSAHGQLEQQLNDRGVWEQPQYDVVYGDYADSEARGGFMKIAYFAGFIPYLQGTLLFLLAASFPFFSIFLITPSRVKAFFVWMSLWVWVKSWDVGFAAIHFIREILLPFLAQGSNTRKIPVDLDDPAAFYQLVTQNDPLANFNTYTTIIALLTISVPFLTANFCMGATNLFDSFKNSIDRTADRYKTAQTNAANRDKATVVEGMINRNHMSVKTSAMQQAYNNPGTTAAGVNRSMIGSGGMGRYINSMGAMATYNNQWSSDMRTLRAQLSALTTRKHAHAGDEGGIQGPGKAFGAWANLQTEGQTTTAAHQQSNLPFIASTTPNVADTSIDITKGSPESSVTDADGA